MSLPRLLGARVAMRLAGHARFTRGAQVLLVTGSAVDRRGGRWVQVDLPRRPNGSRGWVPEEAVVALARMRTRLLVRVGARTVQVIRGGRPVAAFAAAVGRPATPTATGLFSVVDRVPSRGTLGPYVLVLTAYSDVLTSFLGSDGVSAIHGWGDARALGRAVSAGCVRLSRAAMRRAALAAPPGTPVEILP